MTEQRIRTQVLKLYRVHRATMNPQQAIAATRCAFADQMARDIAYHDNEVSSHDVRAWQYADMLDDLIQARQGRGLYAGQFWRSGQLGYGSGLYAVQVYSDFGSGSYTWCRSLACAIRRGMSAMRGNPGWSFTVTDRRGRVYVDRATELSTMGELFTRATVTR
jgi:hypothetical protein